MNLADYFEFRSLELSRLKNAEINEAVELINPAYSYQEHVKGEPRTNPKHLRQRAAETEFYVVKDSSKVVGCVSLEPKGTSLHFGLLTVATQFRKTGLAQAVMKALELYAIDNDYHSLELGYMSLAPWLKRYYENYGFRETGAVVNWGTIDLLHMRKDLK
jgi:predicted GNAT family N-acyltransferase